MMPEIYTTGLDVKIMEVIEAANETTARPATACSFRVDWGKSPKGCSLAPKSREFSVTVP